MNPLETYLQSLYELYISAAGVPETSGYGALANLFNEVGKPLKPRVRCIINIANKGAGIPDGGLFTPDQFQKRAKGQLIEGQLPSRGAIEVKPVTDDVDAIANSEQIRKYLGRYGQVLITNYRDFLLLALDRDGNLVKRERLSLAKNAAEFWKVAAHPNATANQFGDRFVEYLKRVMLHAAPLTQPKDVAWFLASYARDAKARIEETELPALDSVRAALEEALGLRFEGEKGEHFFRSTLVQTLFYGVFSAWVLWSKKNRKRTDKFDWRNATWELHVPMIKALFEQVATPSKLEAADLVEVLDWTGDVLNRVDRDAFFANFEEAHAVQYFYEPFLHAFDPELRKELGVWFTPTEIVKYMVARVDTVLREELEIADGLADPRVYVLDPCCGTGAYLVEVLHKIHETAKAKGEDALAADDLKRAAMNRVFGFEILPAPFVVSHLQLGLLLQNLGAPLKEGKGKDERVGVYLTNSLTGWELRDQSPLNWPELEEERRSSGVVKRDKPILVILGNPPYNAFAGRSPKEEEGLVEDYKGIYFEDSARPTKLSKKSPVKPKRIRRYRLSDPISTGGWGIKKFNLDELYVRFFRLAERRIAEKTGKGVVCFISNFSYLSDPSFVIMRERFLAEFDGLWLDSMNGDSRETGKLTPEGKPDPSIFSTEYNREGIRVGTAIGLFVRKHSRSQSPHVKFREFWGVTKRADLLKSLDQESINSDYLEVVPNKGSRLSFRPYEGTTNYRSWPRLIELSREPPNNGLMEKRAGALIDIDKEALEARMKRYYDPNEDWPAIKALGTGLTRNAARFDAKKARSKALAIEQYEESHLCRYAVRPFDSRWSYYSATRPIWNEPRPTLWEQHWEGNAFLMSRPSAASSREGVPFFWTLLLGDNDFLRGHAYYFPQRLKTPLGKASKKTKEKENLGQAALGYEVELESHIAANLSSATRAYLAALGINDTDATADASAGVWMHVLAIGYTPTYLGENSDGIREDWPRIPLPSTKDRLLQSAELGRRIATLLDTENAVDGVTAGTIQNPFKHIGSISHFESKSLNPSEDLKLIAGWGHAGKDGATMPGKGKAIERDYSTDERKAIERGAHSLGLSTEEALAHLGENTFDIYLNDVAYWKNIPVRVWDYTIGGYQVIKKWLSYREFELLGRPLTPDEAREIMNIARRITAIVLLEPALDANYEAVKRETYSWPESTARTDTYG